MKLWERERCGEREREAPYRRGRFFAVILWNTSGFDCAGTCADEVADPGTTYPQALMLAVAMVVCTYAAPTLVGLVVLPETKEWEDGRVTRIHPPHPRVT